MITWTTERRKLSDLVPWPRNPRKINDAQGKRLAESFDEFGQVETIAIAPNGDVLNGHQRLKVLAAQHGKDYTVDVRVASRALTEKEREKLTVYLHKGAAGEFDMDFLLAEFDMGDLVEWGFEQGELDAFGGDKKEPVQDPGPQIDKADELQVKWQTSTGQIWRIGEHVVICGDCRDADAWQRLLSAAGVERVNGVFTSPPYAEQRKEQYGGVPTGEYVDWWEAVQANVRAHLATDGSFFVNIKPHCEDGQRVLYVMDLVTAMVRRWGWRFVEELVWHNTAPAPGHWDERFKNGFEPVYQFSIGKTTLNHDEVSEVKDTAWVGAGGMNHAAYGGKAGQGEYSKGLVRPSNVISCSGSSDGLHAAAFPVALPDFFIRAYSDPGDVWLDPFLGSGTTIVAAHQNNRRCVGIEMLPKYVAVILERLQAATEQDPELLT